MARGSVEPTSGPHRVVLFVVCMLVFGLTVAMMVRSVQPNTSRNNLFTPESDPRRVVLPASLIQEPQR